MIAVKDIYWAAGFLEGEGSFSGHYWNTAVLACQMQREPLDRLKKLFGGAIKVNKTPSGFSRKHAHYWSLNGPRGRGLMMTIYSVMSPNRKAQIKKVLDKWRACAPQNRYKKYCIHGHEFTRANTRPRSGGKRSCRVCDERDGEKRNRARRKQRNEPHESQLAFPKFLPVT